MTKEDSYRDNCLMCKRRTLHEVEEYQHGTLIVCTECLHETFIETRQSRMAYWDAIMDDDISSNWRV